MSEKSELETFYFAQSLEPQFLKYNEILSAYSLFIKLNSEKNQGINQTSKLIKGDLEVSQSSNNPWTSLELESLIQGINIYGIGNWGSIRKTFREIFNENQRTRDDLANKWYSLIRKSKYKRLDINEMAKGID
ncbi:Myb-like DNA-binding domain containing protein [Trichomonas vaginalis G3]|uniref:Myb-like DNA-binding domain containing protein n=1 Tax=Trichomonas vaginalis (strain ATCC PRA-98 / G3) TaxID=412133 RepID=A2DJ84_TRIV3|nr:SANT/myb-like telomere repeat binding factor-like DNA-binding domain-containing protein [Trichomonas vaginalis G3]EAY19471.1 Myb-like DNA-binding domain containing protein [Trichomonas vaginalis G3]KAI5520050.1 SANT/myb-like telomere repeat binding factor-like DNA-binding domain-containing protein [Trichomonas vaginalis G3]|eukprot:XP_001580457.1 Myb-like DNA-binding domain containing protein [Trichomonas vaginalis G3]